MRIDAGSSLSGSCKIWDTVTENCDENLDAEYSDGEMNSLALRFFNSGGGNF